MCSFEMNCDSRSLCTTLYTGRCRGTTCHEGYYGSWDGFSQIEDDQPVNMPNCESLPSPTFLTTGNPHKCGNLLPTLYQLRHAVQDVVSNVVDHPIVDFMCTTRLTNEFRLHLTAVGDYTDAFIMLGFLPGIH